MRKSGCVRDGYAFRGGLAKSQMECLPRMNLGSQYNIAETFREADLPEHEDLKLIVASELHDIFV